MNISVEPDPEEMQVPWLAVASDILREQFSGKGDSLPVAARNINKQFDGFPGLNKDSLNRALRAGYKKGLQSVSIALPTFYFLCRFYNVDGVALLKKMGEEKLRRWLFAELAKQQTKVNDYLAPLDQILKSEEEVATLTGWLSGTGYKGNLNDYYGALAMACKEAGINTTAGELRHIVASITD